MSAELSDRMHAVLGIAAAPAWKLWISASKRKEARRFLQKEGHQFVPALVRIAAARATIPERVYRCVDEVLCRADEAMVEALIAAAQDLVDPDAICYVAGRFHKLGRAASKAVPVLEKWYHMKEDPRLTEMREHRGHYSTHDKPLFLEMSGQSHVDYEWNMRAIHSAATEALRRVVPGSRW